MSFVIIVLEPTAVYVCHLFTVSSVPHAGRNMCTTGTTGCVTVNGSAQGIH